MKAQKSTEEIRQILNSEKIDFDSAVNKALNAYLPRIFLCCPFTDELCIGKKQCIGCEVHQVSSEGVLTSKR